MVSSDDSSLNLLVIMTDQQSASAMGCAGHADVRTPAIDSLAAQGVRFSRAYCTSPLCAPARASVITGQMPSQLGVDDNIQAVPDSFPRHTLGRIFTDAGYDCAYAGKWHIPGVPHGARPAHPGNVLTSGFDQIYTGTHEGLAEACTGFLTAPERGDRPFLLVASFNEPHGICEWARGQAPPSGEIDEPDWRELPLLPPNFAPGSEEPEALRLIQQFAWAVHPTQAWDEEKWRRYRYAYYRLCERVDTEIAKLLAGLDASGQRENTLIVFTSDHGDMQGAHRWNQKKNLYEESAGVPFIVTPPPAASPPNSAGQVLDELVSVGLDLLPTLCDYAGVKPDLDWAGHSIRPLIDSSPTALAWREHVVAETRWTFPGLMPPPVMAHLDARMLRTSGYKYMCFSWGQHREQLFDLQSDPGEMINLATSGAHQHILADHRVRLADHCSTIGDSFTRHIPPPEATPR